MTIASRVGRPSDLKVSARARIARFKVPRHIRFADDMPLTATGKPQKFRMREIMAKELDADAA